VLGDELDDRGLVSSRMHRCCDDHGVEHARVRCCAWANRIDQVRLVPKLSQTIGHELGDLLSLTFCGAVDQEEFHGSKLGKLPAGGVIS